MVCSLLKDKATKVYTALRAVWLCIEDEVMYIAKRVDLTGKRFGRLVVICRAGKGKGWQSLWLCRCDCGSFVVVRHSSLTSGNTKSCGCYHRDYTAITHTKHGHFGDRLYFVWNTMKGRCNNPNNQKYKDYGGRGIKVCDEWANDFMSFYIWAMNNGYDPDAPYGVTTIDRIDVNGDYCPDNCQWVDMKTQSQNKRANHNQYTTKFV